MSIILTIYGLKKDLINLYSKNPNTPVGIKATISFIHKFLSEITSAYIEKLLPVSSQAV